jgi:hypothetical protein
VEVLRAFSFLDLHTTTTTSSSSGLQIVYCCWLTFELVYIYFFIIETKGRTLEETAALFDGEEAEAAVHAGAQDIHEDNEKGSDSGYTPHNALKA